jgi:2-keto-3-deoxy-L-rhamnonate aldolase RhmA
MGDWTQRLRNGERLLGSFHALTDPNLIELVARCGFDFVVVEYEHGLRSVDAVQNMIRAADVGGIPCLVRIGVDSIGDIGRFLDAGAAGVLVAHVTSPEVASAAVSAARYPPEGRRGLGAGRGGTLLGADGDVHGPPLVIAIVENPEGVEAIEEIVRVPGLSGVLPGAGDLSLSQGLFGVDGLHPVVAEQVARVSEAANAHEDCLLMTFLREDPSDVEDAVLSGAQLILFGLDTMLIASAYRDLERTARASLTGVETRTRR